MCFTPSLSLPSFSMLMTDGDDGAIYLYIASSGGEVTLLSHPSLPLPLSLSLLHAHKRAHAAKEKGEREGQQKRNERKTEHRMNQS